MADPRKAARRAARKYGLNEDIFLAQIGAESGFNPNAVSPAGARGIAQFIDSTAKAYGVDTRDGRIGDDLDGAARYMRDNLKRTGGNYKQALSIYNSGRPDGHKTIAETKGYVAKILGSANGGRSAGGGGGIELERGAEKLSVEDPELMRRQFFAQWMAKKNPQHPLLRLGALDPNMSTKKTVSIPTVTGFKAKGAGGRDPVTGRPGGSYAGTTGIVTGLSRDAKRFNVATTSGKRDRLTTASGNVSDHAKANKNANARDWSGAVADMDRWAKHLQKKLGFRDWKGAQTVTKQIGGNVYRFQMIYRTNVGGNHHDHVHLGVSRVD